VPARDEPAAEWKEGDAYASLLRADRAILAWEWLRRRADYRLAAGHLYPRPGIAAQPADRGAERWGLHGFEPSDLPAPCARPLWRAEFHPYVLEVAAAPGTCGDDSFDLVRFAGQAKLALSPQGAEHLLLTDGLRTIRLDVIEGSLRSGPVQLHYRISGMDAAQAPLLTLRRLLAFGRHGRFLNALHPPEARARRVILLLRAHDALATGATQRQIAEVLLDATASRTSWRSESPSLRSQAQRLIRGAREMLSGGFWQLLRTPR